MEDVLQFLQELSVNNNRDWFETNKDRYKKCREKVLFITDVLINELQKFDRNIPVLDPKDCLFRIYRDVRFSDDKRPYKTNFGSFISKGGRKGDGPGYYFHIEPGQSFMGGGVYKPASGNLKAIRRYIARFPEEFAEIIRQPAFKKALPEMYDDQVKTVPKGFSADHEFIHLLRYRSFVFSANISDEELISGTFIEKAVEAFRRLAPVNAYLNEALK